MKQNERDDCFVVILIYNQKSFWTVCAALACTQAFFDPNKKSQHPI